MPLNRKNRVTVKKIKVFTKKIKKLNGWAIAEDYCLNSVIQDNLARKIINNSSDGCTCQKCGQFNEYAEANQSDGTFLCFTCRNP